MSKTSAIQRIETLKGWMFQMEREGKTFKRYRKVIQNKEEEETPLIVPKEE